MAALSAAAIPKLSFFKVQGMANMAWACAELGVVDTPLLNAISASSIRTLSSLPRAATPAGAAGLSGGAAPLGGAAAFGGGEGSKAVLSLAQALAASNALQDEVYFSVAACLRRFAAGLEEPGGRGEELPGEVVNDEEPSAPRVLKDFPDLCVLWKPPGWTVTVSDDLWQASVPGLFERPLQDWISKTLGRAHPVNSDLNAQFGLVHRLDKDTSGALICAKTYKGYLLAQLQFTARRTCKIYVCLCHGAPVPARAWLDAPLRFARRADGLWRSYAEASGKPALTEVREVAHAGPEGEALGLVRLRLHTGRQHQIRAHLSTLGHPLVADLLYGGHAREWCKRCFLHAERLSLNAGAGPVDASCPLPADLRAALDVISARDGRARALLKGQLG